MSVAALVRSGRAARDALAALSARQIAWLVFLSTLLVYVALVPWVSRRWWLTGDEPHYLVVTHSLLTDGDLELANNYQEKDFTLFYVGSELDRHVATGPDGGAYPSHAIGLSVVLLPAYALGYLIFGTHAGVLYFLTTMGALLAANVYLLCYEVTGRKFSSLLAWVTTAFTVPVMHYAYQVYPEIMGALLLVWSLRHIRRGGHTRPHIWLMVGLCIGFLPCLVSRFLILSAFLGAAALYSITATRTTARYRTLCATALSLPVVALAGLLMAFNSHFYGSISPVASQLQAGVPASGFLPVTSVKAFGAGLAGWLLDQDRGLLIYSPVYIVALPGVLLMLKERRRDALLLALPFVGMYFALASRGYWAQWSIVARYFVAVLPAIGCLSAYAVQRVQSKSFMAIGSVLLLLSVTAAAALICDPELSYAYRLHGRAGLLSKCEELSAVNIERLIPSFRQHMTVLYADGPLGDEVGEAVSDTQALGGHRLIASDQRVTHAHTIEEESGFIFNRRWPEEEYPVLLPKGSYSACFRIKAEGSARPTTVVAVVEVSISGAVLARREITRGDFADEGYGVFCQQFDYAGQERLSFSVLFTDQTDLWVDWAMLERLDGSLGKWGLSAFWLSAVVAFTGYYYARWRHKPEGVANKISTGRLNAGDGSTGLAFGAACGLLVVLIIATFGGHLYSTFSATTFEAEELRHLTGQVVADPEASGGQAAYASKDMEKNALVYGPYEFFRPGEYEVRFRIKRGAAAAEAEVAAVDVYGFASDVLVMQSLMSDDFEGAERYQEFRLLFSNAASQALQFRVHFFGAADLWVDTITVQRLRGSGLGLGQTGGAASQALARGQGAEPGLGLIHHLAVLGSALD